MKSYTFIFQNFERVFLKTSFLKLVYKIPKNYLTNPLQIVTTTKLYNYLLCKPQCL